MVYGDGMMAKVYNTYKNRNDIVIFAQGVSNSQETDPINFKREEDILQSVLINHQDKIIIYFSTCSVDDLSRRNSPYVLHKLRMEKLIQKSGLDYYIFRLPQVVGNATNTTLVNYISSKIKKGENFQIWEKAKKNLIDVDDVYKITNYLIERKIFKNNIICVASSVNTDIFEIVHSIEKRLNKKAVYTSIPEGSDYKIDISKIEKYLDELGIFFSKDYIDRIIEKYVKP